jgi:hypothetical protein
MWAVPSCTAPPLPPLLSTHQSVLQNAGPSTTLALCHVLPTSCFHPRYTMRTYRVQCGTRVGGALFAYTISTDYTANHPSHLSRRQCRHRIAKRSPLHYPRPVPCAPSLAPMHAALFTRIVCMWRTCGWRVDCLYQHQSCQPRLPLVTCPLRHVATYQ